MFTRKGADLILILENNNQKCLYIKFYEEIIKRHLKYMLNKTNGLAVAVLEPWWVTGITDSEGSFSAYVSENTGKLSYSYKVAQKDESSLFLYDLIDYFKCGAPMAVERDSRGYSSFTVTKLKDLETKIIPHFLKYPLITSKHLDFLSFKEIIAIVSLKEHLTPSPYGLGIGSIKDIIVSMNRRRSFQQKYEFLMSRKQITSILNPHWVQAFINGEGSYYFYIGTRQRANGHYTTVVQGSLEIAQNSHQPSWAGKGITTD